MAPGFWNAAASLHSAKRGLATDGVMYAIGASLSGATWNATNSVFALVSFTPGVQLGPVSTRVPVCGLTLWSSEKDQPFTGAAVRTGAAVALVDAGRDGHARANAR